MFICYILIIVTITINLSHRDFLSIKIFLIRTWDRNEITAFRIIFIEIYFMYVSSIRAVYFRYQGRHIESKETHLATRNYREIVMIVASKTTSFFMSKIELIYLTSWESLSGITKNKRPPVEFRWIHQHEISMDLERRCWDVRSLLTKREKFMKSLINTARGWINLHKVRQW